MNVVVTGSLGFDYIMDFSGRFADRIMPEALHKISLSFLVDTLNKQFGGTSGNIAYTLKLLGVEPFIHSAAGRDFVNYKKFLQKRKISTKYIKEFALLGTGSYFGITDQDDNQIGAYYQGALKRNHELTLKDVDEKIDLVIISPTTPRAMVHYVRECIELKLPYLYDPAFQIAQFSQPELHEGIEHATILIGNDYEIELIARQLEISREQLIGKVPVLVTTLGGKGSIIETPKESIHIKPAVAKNTSDPTGAGDAYRAGFVAGYLRGFDLTSCGQMGSVAAVYTVEKYGTQTHTFTKKEFIKRYAENYNQTLVL